MSIRNRLYGWVGSRGFTGDGNSGEVRLSNELELLVAHGRGKYAQAVKSGTVYIASIGVAGVAPGTALSTTPPISIHNPDDSGVLLSILRVAIGYVSGTLGAGLLAYAQATDAAAPTGGTALTPVNAKLGNTSVGHANCGTGHTVDATPTIIRASGISLGASLASTAELPVMVRDDLDGEIMVMEGKTFVVQGVAAAGSSPLIIISVTYQEILNG